MLDESNIPVPNVEASQTQPVEQQPKKEDSPNFKALRERAEGAERRLAELERAMQQNMSQQKTTKLELVDDDFSIDDDSLIEGKHLKKLYSKQKQELSEIKKMLQESTQQNQSASAEWKLKTRYTDFDSIVNEDNIRKFAEARPALYRSMLSNPDLYEKGETAYEMIKTFVISDKYAAQDKKIEDNKTKPRSAATASAQVGETPLSHIEDYDRRELSEERKAQLRQQVAQAKKYSY